MTSSNSYLLPAAIEAIKLTGGGYSYCLIMDETIQNSYKRTNHSIHPRTNQPCWGELRKYVKDECNKNECTQPETTKPGDLHTPFPKGTPIHLLVNLGYSIEDLTRMFSDSVLGDVYKNLEFFPGKGWHNIVHFKNLNVDPTVLVFGLKYSNSFARSLVYMDMGFTAREASALAFIPGVKFFRGVPNTGMNDCGNSLVSIRRLLEAKPRDYSGGTFKDRVDYNRRMIEQLFHGTPKEGCVSFTEALVKAGVKSISKDTVEEVRKVLYECAANEVEPVNELYIWKTLSGKTNAPKEKKVA